MSARGSAAIRSIFALGGRKKHACKNKEKNILFQAGCKQSFVGV